MIDADVVEVTLQDLETAAAMVDNLSAMRLRDYEKCLRFGEMMAKALRQGLPLRVHTPSADAMRPQDRWRLPLQEAPEPWRARIERSLTQLTKRFDSPYVPERVEFVF